MFETSHVRAQVAAQRRYGLLTVSLVIHTAVVIAVVAASIASLSLPTNAPRELPAFVPVLPIALPVQVGVRTPPRAAAPQPAQKPAPRPAVETAPQTIPDAIVPAAAAAVDSSLPAGPDNGGLPIGDPKGVPNGLPVTDTMPATPVPVQPQVYRAVGEVRSARVLQRVEPLYPRAALMSHLAGTVELECIIDKDGHVRDAHVVRSSMAIFDQPALDALQRWTFAPGVLRGQQVDTWFNLTVTFQPR